MKRGHLVLLLLLLLGMAGSSGCAALALTVFSTGAGLGASTSTSYILDSIAYKTFTIPEQGVRKATLITLKRMAIEVKEDQATEGGTKIVAVAGDRTIEVELDRLTGRTTRMRVDIKRGWFFRDRATATEIIIQTERTLDDNPKLAREAMPTTSARAGLPRSSRGGSDHAKNPEGSNTGSDSSGGGDRGRGTNHELHSGH